MREEKEMQELAVLGVLRGRSGYMPERDIAAELVGNPAFSDAAKGRSTQVKATLQRIHARPDSPVLTQIDPEGGDFWVWSLKGSGAGRAKTLADVAARALGAEFRGEVPSQMVASDPLAPAPLDPPEGWLPEAPEIETPECSAGIVATLCYKTPDGGIYETLPEARAHIDRLRRLEMIQEFLRAAAPGGDNRAELIQGWEEFRATRMGAVQ